MLLAPIRAELARQIELQNADAASRTLFCNDFVRIMIYAFAQGIDSLRLVATNLQTSPVAARLGLPKIPFTTLRDGFERFPVTLFQALFAYLVTSGGFVSLPELQALGSIWLIDASLFPAMLHMEWASYRKTKQAFRFHLAFELNRMIPIEFAIGSGKSSERAFLTSVLREGVTYIADRGYFAFDLLKTITEATAFFVMRAKVNLKYTVQQTLPVTDVPSIFTNTSDRRVTLTNDAHQETYRLVCFSIAGTEFLLVTNRFDLTTFQIIILYAYRWQVELVFRFLKRTLNGLHLFKQCQQGLQIQFYLLLMTALLQLRLKQHCLHQRNPKWNEKQAEPQRPTSATDFFNTIGQKLDKYWKIGRHWLTKFQNRIASPFDKQTIEILGAG